MFEEDPDAPKRVTKPGTSVTVTEAAILVGTVATSSITKLGEKAGEEIAKGMERAYNYFSNFQIPNLSNFCRGSYAALGASIGFFGGSAVGSLGFAGGPAGVFTTSAGAAGGTYVGTSLGIQAGNILCNSGGGGDGGGGQNSFLDPSNEKKFWKDLKPFRGKTKSNGQQGKAKRYYTWDHTHGDLEVYDGRGRHLGSADPQTGAMTKPAVAGRKIEI
jgi:hypothetical protein